MSQEGVRMKQLGLSRITAVPLSSLVLLSWPPTHRPGYLRPVGSKVVGRERGLPWALCRSYWDLLSGRTKCWPPCGVLSVMGLSKFSDWSISVECSVASGAWLLSCLPSEENDPRQPLASKQAALGILPLSDGKLEDWLIWKAWHVFCSSVVPPRSPEPDTFYQS